MDRAPSSPLVAAIIPARDEAAAIGGVVHALRRRPEVHRVIVVDNGSRDRTADHARSAGAEVVSEPVAGYGRACAAGVRAAAGADVVVLLDGDAADDPADLPRVLAPLLAGGADLVVGSRSRGTMERGAMGAHQRAGNRLALLALRRLHGLSATDLGPLRAIRRRDLMALDMREMTYGWSAEMAAKSARAGLRYAEVPVGYRRRIGVSKVGGTLRGSIGAGWGILGAVVRARRWSPS